MTNYLKVMADHKLDAIVHKAVEHQPTLIKDGIAPPFVDQKGAPHLNTFLVYTPTIVVPAGFPPGFCYTKAFAVASISSMVCGTGKPSLSSQSLRIHISW